MQQKEFSDNSSTYLLFTIIDKNYAIDINNVIEVIEVQEILEMPDMPEYIKGVINLRGNVISIVDMRKRMGLIPSEMNEKECIIIIKVGSDLYGLMVDNVNTVTEINSEDIDVPSALSVNNHSITSGTAKVNDLLCILLNINNLV